MDEEFWDKCDGRYEAPIHTCLNKPARFSAWPCAAVAPEYPAACWQLQVLRMKHVVEGRMWLMVTFDDDLRWDWKDMSRWTISEFLQVGSFQA
jgi:hypothetical protein